MSSTGTQSALREVGAGTTEQQRILLKATLLTPRAVGRKQVVDFLSGAGAAYLESITWEMKAYIGVIKAF